VSGDKGSRVFPASQNIQILQLKDVKRMSENLTNLLGTIVELLKSHGSRIEALEEEELEDNADEASLMESADALLAQLQTPSQVVPSDQM
jgi:hypothetical protein